jgi:hypothetical protein
MTRDGLRIASFTVFVLALTAALPRNREAFQRGRNGRKLLVDQTILNWNQIIDWLRRLENLRTSAVFEQFGHPLHSDGVPATAEN